MRNKSRHSEGKDSVLRFEEMLKTGEVVFFDLTVYEFIINYFIEEGKFNKALKACNYAIEQYPYSTELFLDKANLLIKKQKFDEALEYIEKAELFQPRC